MPDQRSIMNEYRTLDEKRLAQGLTPAEQARLEKLRVLVGPELGAGTPRPGFDVNAAAAALRESLLPAGLRNRPPPTPVQAPPPPPEPEPEPAAPSLGDALASEYAESPFASLDPAAEPAQELFFDPASLGSEPEGAGAGEQAYPPDAAYATDAGQGWDPTQPYDPNAQPYDPNAQPYDPNAQPYDPNAYPAEAASDANAPQAWDASQGWDESGAQAAAYPAEAGAETGQGWAPEGTAEAAPEAAAYPADAGYDAGAPQAWEAPAAEPQPEEATALSDAELTELEPTPGEAAPPDGGSFTPGDLGGVEGWTAEQAPPEPAQDGDFGVEGWAEEPPPAPEAPQAAIFGTYDEAGAVAPFAPGTLGAEPPVDAAFLDASAEPAAAAPGTGDPALGEYDDIAGFAVEPFDASAVPAGTPGLDAGAAPELDAGTAPELDASWQPEAALDAGFELASGGSFAAGADAAAPEWAQAPAPPPWEAAALDAGAAPAQADADAGEYEIAPPPASETFGTLPVPADLFGAPQGDLAAPEEPVSTEAGATPELDFSQPDFSGGEELDREPPAGLADAAFAAPGELAEPFDAGDDDAAPLELEAPPAEPAWDALAAGEPLPELASPEGTAAELTPETPAGAETTTPPDEILEPTELVEEEPSLRPAGGGDVTGFADAAAAAVAAEPTDLAGAITADAEPGALEPLPPEPAPAAFDLAAAELSPAEQSPAELPPAELSPAELPAAEAAPAEELSAPELAAEQPPGEAPPPTEERSPLDAAIAAAPPLALSDEELPTIDGADILEEIVEEVPGAAPPQSLEFEPLEPEAPVAPPPPEPAPAAVARPSPAVVARPPVPAIAPPPPVIVAPPPAAAPAAAPAGDYRVAGTHRVVVHTVEGHVKRGVAQDLALDAPALALAAQPGAAEEQIATDKVKAIFFMLAPGEKPPVAEGKRVRVTFHDGRQLAGFSPDYRAEGLGFFMVPADTRTNTGRIWVFRSAVRQVAVS